LEVFNQRKFKDSAVVGLADDDRNFGESEQLGGAPASFTGNEFEVAVLFTNDQGLDDALFFDGVGKFAQSFGGKILSRLKRAGADAGQRNALNALTSVNLGRGGRNRWCCRWDRSGRLCDGATAQQGSQATAQTWLCHERKVTKLEREVNVWGRRRLDLVGFGLTGLD
jgi:hypothetical protein